MADHDHDDIDGLAFLLAQIGAHASARFGERLVPLRLSPPHAGILWNLGRRRDLTQRELSELLQAFASRLVIWLDELEKWGLLERVPSPKDRRSHTLRLTSMGRIRLKEIRRIARAHEDDLCASLSRGERVQLQTLLRKIASHQQLRPRVHPGYRKR